MEWGGEKREERTGGGEKEALPELSHDFRPPHPHTSLSLPSSSTATKRLGMAGVPLGPSCRAAVADHIAAVRREEEERQRERERRARERERRERERERMLREGGMGGFNPFPMGPGGPNGPFFPRPRHPDDPFMPRFL